MNEIIDIYISFLKYDLEVMSQPWMWGFILPGIIYTVFFLFKWIVLTAPLWLPIRIIFGKSNNNDKERDS